MKKWRSAVDRLLARRPGFASVDRRTAVTHQGTMYEVVRKHDGSLTVLRHGPEGEVVSRPDKKILLKARKVFAALDAEDVMTG